MIEILKKYHNSNFRAVCHCFSSDVTMLNKLLEFDILISLTGSIIYSKGKMDEVIRVVPLEKLMLETDSPYMTPPPERSKRNLPKNVFKVAEYISNIKHKK
jgi:TatD DNase family protein